MNRISAAINASRAIRTRYVRNSVHELHDIDPSPDADGSTAFLEELSAELLREKFPRRPLVKHPERSNVWVRQISDRDRSPLVSPSSQQGGPGRNIPEGGEAA